MESILYIVLGIIMVFLISLIPKELFEVDEFLREKKTEGDKIFEISRFIANDTLQSKEIIITDATTGRILKYYEVEDCFCDNPSVTEKTIEYWD